MKLFFTLMLLLVTLGGTWGTGACGDLWTAGSAAGDLAAAERFLEEGNALSQRGGFEEAIGRWEKALRLFVVEKRSTEQVQVLVKLAEAYGAIGDYRSAKEHLAQAHDLAENAEDLGLRALVRAQLGRTYFLLGQEGQALQLLTEAQSLAEETKDRGLSALIWNDLGGYYCFQQQYAQAGTAYDEAISRAEQRGKHLLAAVAVANRARALAASGDTAQALTSFAEARRRIGELEPSHDKAFVLITIGLGYQEGAAGDASQRQELRRRAFEALREAAAVAETIGDRRAASYAWGYLGALYEAQAQWEEALSATRKASFAAQQASAPESLYRWQWQTGRVYKAQGKMDEAIGAYRRAIDSLESIRQELTASFASRRSSFRESVGALYFELVDLLLQRAAALKEKVRYEPYLREARERVERLKLAELREYFQDECVDVAKLKEVRLDEVSQHAAVIYPILLPDRMELLVGLPDGLTRVSVPVGADELTREVRQLRRLLEKRISREYLPHSQKLYNWLIRPLLPELKARSMDTLVFVPDGPLRTIPVAALHDGKKFLVSSFAVAVTPGLNLTDPAPLERENLKVLALGLTSAAQGFPALPYVGSELISLQDTYGAKLLLNEEFNLPSVEASMLKEPYTIVHIASHGQFNRDVEKTFLLTFDGKLTMNRLDQCVGFFRFREKPLELLTLSACQTAAGDDRAALGLAGVAVKAGARSALASLWFINDQASSLLVEEFYRALREEKVSRAAALQQAQLKLLADFRYDHPGYWSPFLLINDWL